MESEQQWKYWKKEMCKNKERKTRKIKKQRLNEKQERDRGEEKGNK